MKKSNLSLFTLLLLCSVFVGPVFSQSEEAGKLRTEIEELNAKMIKAMDAEDHETLKKMYTEDVYSMPSYEPMTKGLRPMIERQMEDKKAGFKMLSMKFDIVEVIPAGKYAIEIGNYDVKMKVPQMDEPINDKGKYVTVWERQEDGSLKIRVETWNTNSNPMEMAGEMHPEHKEKMDRQ